VRSAELKLVPPQRNFDGYEAIFEQSSDAILAFEASGKITAVNRAAEELTGYLREELEAGVGIRSLMPDGQGVRVPHRARRLSFELLATPGTYEDVAVLRKDGFLRLVELGVRPLLEAAAGESRVVLALLRDVTEKKRMERELITKHAELRSAYQRLERQNAELRSMQELLVQAGKLAALGELTAGIAHELNQPLQAIRGYAQELEPFVSGLRGSAPGFCREIVSNTDKMAAIIKHLRAFARGSVEGHEPTDVHAAIEEALKLVSRQLAARGIQVHREYDPSLPRIHANPLQLEQVFINLATNARDAIGETGRGSGNIWIRTRAEGRLIEVEFRDDGAGMPELIKAKVFNPFFTTKEVGKGMGLGLSLSYGMVSSFHGSMVVESEPEKGAVFRIRLPVDYRSLA
jgi:PAS domain S-box-containing protein